MLTNSGNITYLTIELHKIEMAVENFRGKM